MATGTSTAQGMGPSPRGPNDPGPPIVGRVTTGRTTDQIPFLIRLYASLLHVLPLAGGLTTLSFNALVNRLTRRLKGPVMAVMRNGVRIEVDPTDYHGRILYLFGTNDPKVQSTAEALLRPGDVFLDIGANYSSIGMQVSPVVGPSGRVHLFEPQPTLCGRVKAAIQARGLNNVELHSVGLLDRDAELQLAQPANHTGMASFTPQFDDAAWERQTLPVRAIASYVPALVGDRPFGAKLDIEGAEPAVMPWLVTQPNLVFLIFEANHHLGQLWELTHGAGLVVYGLARRVVARRLTRVSMAEEMSRYHDMVAIRWRREEAPPDNAHPRQLGALLRG